MSLELIPNNELIFKGPFNAVSITTLKLTNTGNERIAYKIKTTAPKRYCVKPNSGFLNAHASNHVQVMLQPPVPIGQSDDRNKHKFMVQWAAAPDYPGDVDNFWKQDTKTLNVQDSKLKCIFDEPISSVTDEPVKTRNIDAPRTPTDTGDDSTRSRLKQEIERLKTENDSLSDRLKQSESGVYQRSNAGKMSAASTYVTSPKPNSSQQYRAVMFGFPVTEQIIIVALLLAVLFGFSLGYFLFSCSN